MIKINRNYSLSQDTYNQLVALEKQGKTRVEMAKIIGVNKSTMNKIRNRMVENGIWKTSPNWIKRVETIMSKATVSNGKFKSVVERKEKMPKNSININFKGVNVTIEKSSNIIVTENTIFVK